MALIKVTLFHALLLASVSFILTEKQHSERAGMFGLPDFSSFIPNFGSGGDGSAGSYSFSHSFGRSEEASPEGPAASVDNDSDEHHNRLFFSLLPSLTTCNYTLQAGAQCASCRQALTCLPNNVGLLRNCRGFFRYCNNGYCSLFQGSACSSSSSNSTSSTNSTGTGNRTQSFTGTILPTN